jgi:hypothetical protein
MCVQMTDMRAQAGIRFDLVLAAEASGLRVVVASNGHAAKKMRRLRRPAVTRLGEPEGRRGQPRKGEVEFDGVLHREQVMSCFSRQV